MGKRNKIRYQSKPKDKVTLVATGTLYLKYEDDDAMDAAKKGDLLVFPCNDALNTTRQGDYGSTGFSGYFKVDIFEGNVWCPVLLTGVFPDKQHYFSKSECPIDTYNLCAETLLALAGRVFVRTYREHYELEEA